MHLLDTYVNLIVLDYFKPIYVAAQFCVARPLWPLAFEHGTSAELFATALDGCNLLASSLPIFAMF